MADSNTTDGPKKLRLGDFRQDEYVYDKNLRFVRGEATEVPKTKVEDVLAAAKRNGIVLIEAND